MSIFDSNEEIDWFLFNKIIFYKIVISLGIGPLDKFDY
jgi:hypothetical protein